MKINLTFTGIDSGPYAFDLPRDDQIEYAALLSASRMFNSHHHRYPLPWDIEQLFSNLMFHNTALHICGNMARSTLFTNSKWHRLMPLLDRVQRIQINGTLDRTDVVRTCRRFKFHTIITQHTEANAGLLDDILCDNHAILIDNSGGRGILPSEWVRPKTTKRVGFAGGLSPDNIEVEGPKILEVAREGDWIDMESGVRIGNDYFSADKVKAVMRWAQ